MGLSELLRKMQSEEGAYFLDVLLVWTCAMRA